jgi:60 kDa SS-A/Ro ribonucleoprotein
MNPIFQKPTFPSPDATNAVGAAAYTLSAKHALAQLAVTGCFNSCFYVSTEDQIDRLLELVNEVDDTFLAKLAVYSRQRAYMKDMPVALLLCLANRKPTLFQQIFSQVVTNGRTLRTFVQLVRSGRFGRNSLSGTVKRAVEKWLQAAPDRVLLEATGNEPSIRDVLRLARPTPTSASQRALFGWLAEAPVEKWYPSSWEQLPLEAQVLESFANMTPEQQAGAVRDYNLPWMRLSAHAKHQIVWTEIARKMGYQALRMNLNTLQRWGVFENPEMVEYVACRLEDPAEIRRARQFPYQFLAAYLVGAFPARIKGALHQTAELACSNVPKLPPVVIGLDVSGSMGHGITGNTGATTIIRCVDVAALFAAALLRKSPDSLIVPFSPHAKTVDIDPFDSLLSITKNLASLLGGGTDCSIPLRVLNAHTHYQGTILVSDNQSWVGQSDPRTPVMQAWQQKRKPLVCINIQPGLTTQAPESRNILNIGGFSDAVFDVVSNFFHGEDFLTEIEKTEV